MVPSRLKVCADISEPTLLLSGDEHFVSSSTLRVAVQTNWLERTVL